MITPDGGHLELRNVGGNVYEAMDSSHLQMIDNGDDTLLVRTTDGTRLSYALAGDGYRCTQIKDRNGNYLTITNDSEGRLQTVTDTLGRVFTINYDEYNNPISITQTRGGSTFTWATFGYGTVELSLRFDGPNVYGTEDSATIPVLNQVGLPDGSYYTFDYNSYAQVTRVNYYAADDHLLNYIGNDLTEVYLPTDCPRIGAVSAWAENWNVDPESTSESLPVTTTFSAPELADCDRSGSDDDCQETVVTAPDGTEQHTLTRVSGSWDYGLPVLDETWATDDSSPTTKIKQRWVTTTWTQDNTGRDYILNPRITDTYIHDSGNTKHTHIDYETLSVGCGTSCTTSFHLPNSVAEYQADATTVLRTTQTDYLETTNYLDRRIIGLPVEKRIFDGTSSGTLMAKTGFYYDDTSTGFLVAQGSSIPQFDATNYGSTFHYRGNLTKTRQYEIGTSNYKDSKIGYNTTSSVILTCDPLDHDTTIGYDTSYLAYPVTVTDPDGNHSDVEYNFYTGQKTHSTGQALNEELSGAEMAYAYDSIDRPYTVTRVVDGDPEANSVYYYATSGENVTSYSTIKDLSTYTVASTITDGAGRTIATATEHPGSSGGYKAQTTHYDIMGRSDETSNPTEISSSFIPYGDDYTAGWQYTTQTSDWKGRPLVTTHPDDTTRRASYSGCGCAGGEVVTLQDEGTMISSTLTRRKQMVYSDVLGRMVKAETYNWDGSTVYATVTNTYNALDQITQTRQYSGSTSSGTYQDSTFIYDGYGRLHQSHRPEQFLSDGISLVPDLKYTTFGYNADDTTASVTDARGASTSFTYNNRRLVTQIDYAAPTGSSMSVPASVEYDYDGAGNRTSMTDGLGTVTYAYDQLSRLTDETRDFTDTLSNEPSGHYHLHYAYDLTGLASITDPFHATVEYAHDEAGQTTSISGTNDANTDDYASDLTYRAWGALKSMSYGNGHTMSASYNNRLQTTEFEISDVLHNSYDYQPEGSLTFSHDLTASNSKFDRLMKYDQVGRLEMARTGAEARNPSVTPTNDRPYKEDLTYDAFDNMKTRSGKFWFIPIVGGGTTHSFANNRDDAWDYDVDGRLLNSIDVQYEYDAAGRVVHTESDRSSIDVVYDGDGQRVKSVNSMSDTETPPNTSAVTTYYLPSSVAGQPITELTSTGAKRQGYVFAGGDILAIEKPVTTLDKVLWQMNDPAGFSVRQTLTNGNVEPELSAELDHFGTNAEVSAPSVRSPHVPGEGQQGALNSLGFGDPFAQGFAQCVLNGFEVPCGTVRGHGAFMKAPGSNVGAIYSKSAGKYIGAAIYNPTLASMGISVLGYGVGNNAGWLPVGSTLGNGGVNLPDWFASLSANELRPEGETFVSFNAAALSTSVDNAYYGVSGSLSSGVPAPGRAAPLNGGDRTLYDSERQRLLGVLKKSNSCRQFLMERLGLSASRIARAVRAQRPFDGPRSTNSTVAAGLQSSKGLFSNETVQQFFAEIHPLAATASYASGAGGSRVTDVYFAPEGITAGNILHETLHYFYGSTLPDDWEIARRLGVGREDFDRLGSQTITMALEAAGCG